MLAPACGKYNYCKTRKRASGILQLKLRNPNYFCVGGFAGVGAGVTGCVFAGADTGADFTPCSTDFAPPCLMAFTESVIDVNMNRTAETVVALESAVPAPRGPNAAWLPWPPKAAE